MPGLPLHFRISAMHHPPSISVFETGKSTSIDPAFRNTPIHLLLGRTCARTPVRRFLFEATTRIPGKLDLPT
jgi:hypothetical protein